MDFDKKFIGRKIAAYLLLGFGWLIAFSSGLGAFAMIFDKVNDSTYDGIITAIILFLGIVMIRAGNKKRKLNKNYGFYVSKFKVDESGLIDRYAATKGVSLEVAKKELQELITKSYFDNIYIDGEQNKVIFPWNETAEEDCEEAIGEDAELLDTEEEETEEIECITASCPNCGGINKVVTGEIHSCEYCGSQIRVKG